MRRTTIVAPDEVLDKIRTIAAERRMSMADIIREALEEKAAAYRPRPRSLGSGDSGRTDISRRTAEEPIEPPAWR